jgi:hypothetical protein
MGEGAGGNYPPQFENMRVAKLPPFLALIQRKSFFTLVRKHILSS